MTQSVPERMRVWRNEPNGELVASFPGDVYSSDSVEYVRLDLAAFPADDRVREQIRREAFEEAAEVASKVYDLRHDAQARAHGYGIARAIRALASKGEG